MLAFVQTSVLSHLNQNKKRLDPLRAKKLFIGKKEDGPEPSWKVFFVENLTPPHEQFME